MRIYLALILSLMTTMALAQVTEEKVNENTVRVTEPKIIEITVEEKIKLIEFYRAQRDEWQGYLDKAEADLARWKDDLGVEVKPAEDVVEP